MKENKTILLTYFIIGLMLGAGFIPTISADDSRAIVTLIDEGFEDAPTNFPPVGWSNTGWWYNLYGYAHSGSYWAFSWAQGDTLTTPTLEFGENTELSFWYAAENSASPQTLEVLVDSTSIWTDTGFTHTTYQQVNLDLSAYDLGSHTISWIGQTSSLNGQLMDDILLTTEKDIEPPEITNVDAQPPVQHEGQSVTITCDVTDNKGVDEVYVNITDPGSAETSHLMTGSGSYSYSQVFTTYGVYNYHIYAIDINDNYAESAAYTFEINALPDADFTFAPSSPTTADTVTFTDASSDVDGSIVSWNWDFGDGDTSTLQHPTHVFDDGSYTVTLTVTDDDGATDSFFDVIVVANLLPTADFTYSPSSPTTADTVTFTDLSSDPDGTVVSWDWDFGDGGSSTSQHTGYSYSDDGFFTITLTVEDDDGGTDVYTDTITVTNIGPTADFSYTPSSPTTQDVVTFADLSIDPDGTVVAWDWDFGDTTGSTIQNPTHQYASGTYTVGLTVTDDDGAIDYYSDTITVTNAPPIADFSYSPSSPTTADTVVFTDLSTDFDGTVVSWDWDFGDGDTSILQHPTHVFDDGSYTVTLTVWDNEGASDSFSDVILVTNLLPTADFTYSPPSPVTTADTVTFTDLSTDPDGTIVAWDWDFGDGDTSILQHPTHQFDDGTYTITLTVEDDDGGTDDFSLSITVNNLLPTADFSFAPMSPTTADTVTFTDLSSDPDGTVVAWDWDFGDGGSSTSQHPGYSYGDDGTYTITLTVTDDDGGTDVHTDSITVANAPPTADFTYFPTEPSILDTIDFTDTSVDNDGTIVTWNWDFGDGNTSTLQNPSHQYPVSNTYTVTLTVWDEEGGTDTTSQVIDVTPPVEVENVNQSIFDRGYPIRHAADGDWAGAQSFKTSVTILTSVRVYMRTFGTPEFDLTAELRTDHPEGPLLDTLVLTPEYIGSSWNWVYIDFENTTVDDTTQYFIVFPPAPSGVTTSFGYEWGYAFGNQYDDGDFWFTRDGGSLWRDLPTSYEYTFSTYGYVVN